MLLLLCAALALLSACTAGAPAATPAPTDAPSADMTVQPMATAVPTETPTQLPQLTNAPADATDTPTVDTAAQKAAYRDALQTLLDTHTLPDGTDCGEQPGGDPAGNQFAIVDIDGDGRDELILVYTTTYTAGQTASIWDYDDTTETLRAELIEYPLLTFYTNNMIQAGWSHNQGLAGSFWPYTLYRYDAASDSYQSVAMVDAWEKAFAATDTQGAAFPDAIDAAGAGIVYYIMTNGVYETVAPVSAADYQLWRDSQLNGAAEQAVSFTALTAENIAQAAA